MGVRERLRICEPNHQPYDVVRMVSNTCVMHELQALLLLYLAEASHTGLFIRRSAPLERGFLAGTGGGQCRRTTPFMLPIRRRDLRGGRRPRRPREGSAEHSLSLIHI